MQSILAAVKPFSIDNDKEMAGTNFMKHKLLTEKFHQNIILYTIPSHTLVPQNCKY